MLPAKYDSEIPTEAQVLINCFIRETAFGNHRRMAYHQIYE